jgi:hypothetical protein
MFVGFRIVRPLVQPSNEEIEKFFALYLKWMATDLWITVWIKFESFILG